MRFSRIYIDQHAVDSPVVADIRSRFNAPVEIVKDKKSVYASVHSEQDPVQKGKEVLFLTRNRGAFVKSCPGTRYYTCCGYTILHIGSFCPMDCSYCILQSYFHPPVLQYFVNYSEMFMALDRLFSKKTVSRIGTGEFTDSLVWEPWTGISKLLVSKFSNQFRAVLELKTKTTAIQGLKELDHKRKTILSWSLNTERVIRDEERGTAPLNDRIAAAARCASWGYPLAFHFDPMIIYDGCEEEYRQVVEMLFSRVSPESIVWISIGSFRFMPALKPIIQNRFPGSKIVYGEFVQGLDGKMRYFKPLRMDLYGKMVSWISDLAPDICLYYCMEDDEVWKKTLGFIPAERGGLPKMLDDRAVRLCGLDTSR